MTGRLRLFANFSYVEYAPSIIFRPMTTLTILRYPDKRLHKIARPVTSFDARLKKLVTDMAETMYNAPGVGLAATQVDEHIQLVVIDISDTRNELRVFINPEIVWQSEEKFVYEEGCLSVPDIYGAVERPAQVTVRALNVDGNPFELRAEGLLAVCVQHELDHLKGTVFVEYLSPLKQNRIKSRLLKEERQIARQMERNNERNIDTDVTKKPAIKRGLL
ncbi:MAG: peptide deformylase [Solimicrobium sp.]|nr:peptide deformylase [Solimicrobium sp.]